MTTDRFEVALRIDPCRRWQLQLAVRPTFRACGGICRPRRKPRSLKCSPRCCGECKRFPASPEGDWVVLSSLNVADEQLTTAHRAKLAYVYVRQSSVNQVRQHQESTELQYRLVDRAIGLGWPPERLQVIDEDLGKSGAGGVDRHGFQKLIAEIGLGNAGLVVSLDASRLARNNRDWHQLLELCSLFGVLIADGERLYDPRAYHDRLILGLSGMMSEAEFCISFECAFTKGNARRRRGANCGCPCQPGSPMVAPARLFSILMRRCRPVFISFLPNSRNCKAPAV
ncbi:recombinase family protein [Bradyrhizobium sp. 187]|uniref:recombinase family protein n=1 Tax=Bradyrhizobium sp. 187 TaxID=2782655 RepID=UPI001FFEFCC4|nr:recombinase family protein [Bradyrhizobium sp. 187]